MVNVQKFHTIFSFCSKIKYNVLVFRAEIHIMLASSKSYLCLLCLFMPFWQATNVRNFSIFTIHVKYASLVMPKGDPRDRFFYPTLTLLMDSYILTDHVEKVE